MMSLNEFDLLDQERYISTQNGDLFSQINFEFLTLRNDESNDETLKQEDMDALVALETNQNKNLMNEDGRIISDLEFFNYLYSSDRSTKKNTKKSEKKSYTFENIKNADNLCIIMNKQIIPFSRFESSESDLFSAKKNKNLNWYNEQKEIGKMNQNIHAPEKKDMELENNEEDLKKEEKGLNYFELSKKEKKNSNSPNKIFNICKEKKIIGKKRRKKKI